jgi:uncharacterized protein (DUF3084 family)
MNDSSKADGSTILFGLMLAIIVSGGISSAASSLGSKDAAISSRDDTIATQQKQIEKLEQQIAQSDARFNGFVEGLRK